MTLSRSRSFRASSSQRRPRSLVFLFSLILPLLLTSCVTRQAKDIIRDKHVTSHILRKRLLDDDPKNDPTQDQLKRFMISTAKDWESMDIMINNWKSSKNMKKIDLE